jgi:hypothetical protein
MNRHEFPREKMPFAPLSPRRHSTVGLRRLCFTTIFLLVCAGCAVVRPSEQRLVSKPNMVFSESAVFSYANKLVPQLEPGSAFSGGGQSAGCTSCK